MLHQVMSFELCLYPNVKIIVLQILNFYILKKKLQLLYCLHKILSLSHATRKHEYTLNLFICNNNNKIIKNLK